MPAQPPCWVGFSILSTILTLPSSFLVTTAASYVPTTCSRCISFNASRSALASSTLSYSPAYRNTGLSLIERSFPFSVGSSRPNSRSSDLARKLSWWPSFAGLPFVPTECSLHYQPMGLAGSSPLRPVPVVFHITVEVLLHGVLYPLPGNQEDGAPADVHAVVGDTLQVVDHQGRPHAPLRRAASPLGRVGYEVHGLRVQEVHLVVFRLEVAGPL